MKVLDIGNKKVLFEEETGKWLAMEYEGYSIYAQHFQNKNIENQEINKFIQQVNKHLNQKDYDANINEKGLTVLLTNKCNMECIHCFYVSSIHHPKMLKFDDEYCSFIQNYIDGGLRWICFSGGEPLLNPDFKKFIEHASMHNLNISVMTNGMLIDKNMADFLAKCNVNVQVSLDGTGKIYEKIRKNGSYDKAVQSIKLLTDSGVRTDISFLPCKITIGDFNNVVNVAKKLNVNAVHMPFLEKYGRADDNYDLLSISDDELILFLKHVIEKYYAGEYGNVKIGFVDNIKNQLLFPKVKKSCKACEGIVLGIDYTNSVYPCSELITDEYRIGTTNNTLAEIRNNFRKMIRNIADINVDKIEKCKNCMFKTLCGGGCRVQAIISGSLYCEDKNCNILLWVYNEILKKIIELDISE